MELTNHVMQCYNFFPRDLLGLVYTMLSTRDRIYNAMCVSWHWSCCPTPVQLIELNYSAKDLHTRKQVERCVHRQVKTIRYQHSLITNRSLELISRKLSHLQVLVLEDCYHVSKIAFSYTMPHLRSISLNRCHGISDSCVENISTRCPELRDIQLKVCNDLTDYAMKSIRKLNFIQELDISHCTQITLIGMYELCHNNMTLQIMKMPGCGDISDINIGSPLVHCLTFPSLRILDLGCTNITDIGLNRLTSIAPCLTELSLFRCMRLSDIGVAELSRLAQLQVLDLSWTRISKTSIFGLSSFPRLIKLFLLFCPEVSPEEQPEAYELLSTRGIIVHS